MTYRSRILQIYALTSILACSACANFETKVDAQTRKCVTVQECAQQAVEIAIKLNETVKQQQREIDTVRTRLGEVEGKIPVGIEVREGKDLGYGPNHNGYNKTCVKDGLNQVAISTMMGTDNREIAVWCGSLHLVKEQKK